MRLYQECRVVALPEVWSHVRGSTTVGARASVPRAAQESRAGNWVAARSTDRHREINSSGPTHGGSGECPRGLPMSYLIGVGTARSGTGVVQRLCGDPGLHPRPVIYFRGCDGRKIVPRRLGNVGHLDLSGLGWPGRAGDHCVGSAAKGIGTADEGRAGVEPAPDHRDDLGLLANGPWAHAYDVYRCLGLPLTSCHVESMIKLYNRRVIGTEKFWSEKGAEAILQLRSDYLSENEHLKAFWDRRQAEATGRRNFRRTG